MYGLGDKLACLFFFHYNCRKSFLIQVILLYYRAFFKLRRLASLPVGLQFLQLSSHGNFLIFMTTSTLDIRPLVQSVSAVIKNCLLYN